MNSITLPDQKTIILKKQLGEGTFGKVYEIDYKGTPSALKIVDKYKIKDQKLLRAEIDIINKINEKYPNCSVQYILCYQEIQEDQDQIFFISQLMEKDLFEFIQTKDFTDLDLCRKTEILYELLLQIIDGLSVLHKIDIIHRDIKPENFLIGKNDQGIYILKIADFGLSCMIDECKNTRAGTMAYLSPSMLFNLRSQNKETDWSAYDDLYATALVMYECMTFDMFYDVDEIKASLMEPNLTIDDFINELQITYDNNIKNLENWKIAVQKYCTQQDYVKITALVKFITEFLNPQINNKSDYQTAHAKSILKV